MDIGHIFLLLQKLPPFPRSTPCLPDLAVLQLWDTWNDALRCRGVILETPGWWRVFHRPMTGQRYDFLTWHSMISMWRPGWIGWLLGIRYSGLFIFETQCKSIVLIHHTKDNYPVMLFRRFSSIGYISFASGKWLDIFHQKLGFSEIAGS